MWENNKIEVMHPDYFKLESDVPKERESFEDALTSLINCYSEENGSDTPDFILARYMVGCLDNFNSIVLWREKWYGHKNILGEVRDSIFYDESLKEFEDDTSKPYVRQNEEHLADVISEEILRDVLREQAANKE